MSKHRELQKILFGEIVFDNAFHTIKKKEDDVKDNDDVNNGKIYRIYKDINDILYIGSTCILLKKCFSKFVCERETHTHTHTHTHTQTVRNTYNTHNTHNTHNTQIHGQSAHKAPPPVSLSPFSPRPDLKGSAQSALVHLLTRVLKSQCPTTFTDTHTQK